MSTSRPPSNKRPRLSSGSSWKNRGKEEFAKSILGFEEETYKLVPRTSLNVDPRFFPYGIQSGTILEIKGPAKSGKTFLLTYIIARVLSAYPEKKVVLLDTRHKFNVKNLVSIIWHYDKDMQVSISKKCLDDKFPELLENCEKISSYVNRVIVVSCYFPENLMFTLGPSGESQLAKMLLRDERISLVAVDCIDDYSFSETLSNCPWAQTWPNIMDLLKESVAESRCPVIATTVMMALQRSYRKVPKNVTEGNLGGQASADSASRGQQRNDDEGEKLLRNFEIDHSGFTKILEIKPGTEAELKKLQSAQRSGIRISHCATTYLRSKHSAKTAGSGENHRVRFSIFSDMLWVVDRT